MQVQFANPEEITQIAALCGKSFKENEYDKLGIEPSVEKTLTELAEAVAGGVVLVHRNPSNPKKLDGVLALAFSESWFSSHVYLAGLVFYINPEVRSYKLAKSFLETAKEYAIMNDVPIVFDSFGRKDAEQKKKLLKRLGFKDYGLGLIFVP